ncbi:MAG: response regulator [Myxococcota bacterium]|nr:response regulator [Myxococcota bacterium]
MFLRQHQASTDVLPNDFGLFGLISDNLKPTIRPVTKKILIAENELRIAEALERRLKSRGYIPMVVGALSDALENFEAERPDLVVISLTLDNDEGAELCKQMRGRPLGALVPILLLGTGQEAISTVPQAIAIGADHFFRKPRALGELLAKVVTYIGPGTGLDLNESTDDPSDSLGPGPVPASDWAELGGFLRSGESENEGQIPDDSRSSKPSDISDDPVEDDASAPTQFGLPPLAPTAERLSSGPEPAGLADPFPDAPEPASRQAMQPPVSRTPSTTMNALRVGHPVPMTERGFERVLFQASLGRLTGRIEVASSGILRRVFLEEGRVVFVDSSATGEDLSAYLAAEGYVTGTALGQARTHAQQVGLSPEEVLIESGLLSPNDVHEALRGHILQRLFDFFGVERGEVVVIRGGPRPIDPVDLGYTIQRIIMDGIRRKFGRLRLYRVFGTATIVPQRAQGSTSPDWILRPDEANVLASCDGRLSILEIARKHRHGDVDVLATFYGFSVLGMVTNPHLAASTALRQLPVEHGERALAPQTMDQRPGFADLVREKYTDVREGDYFTVLGLERGATGAEIRTAYEDYRRRFDPHRVRKESHLWYQVDEIQRVVQDAYDLLSNERLRQRYESALS